MAGPCIYFSPMDCAMRFWDENRICEIGLRNEVSVSFRSGKHCIGYNDGKQMHLCPAGVEGLKQ